MFEILFTWTFARATCHSSVSEEKRLRKKWKNKIMLEIFICWWCLSSVAKHIAPEIVPLLFLFFVKRDLISDLDSFSVFPCWIFLSLYLPSIRWSFYLYVVHIFWKPFRVSHFASLVLAELFFCVVYQISLWNCPVNIISMQCG